MSFYKSFWGPISHLITRPARTAAASLLAVASLATVACGPVEPEDAAWCLLPMSRTGFLRNIC
jgi:hypothetical protein